VTPDKIVVMSPGSPVEPITLEQMQAFEAPMLSRNPVLHYVFARMAMAEERGMGLRSMRRRAVRADLPLPRYSWLNPYIVLTLFRSKEAAVNALHTTTLEMLSQAERKGWQWIATQNTFTSSDY